MLINFLHCNADFKRYYSHVAAIRYSTFCLSVHLHFPKPKPNTHSKLTFNPKLKPNANPNLHNLFSFFVNSASACRLTGPSK